MNKKQEIIDELVRSLKCALSILDDDAIGGTFKCRIVDEGYAAVAKAEELLRPRRKGPARSTTRYAVKIRETDQGAPLFYLRRHNLLTTADAREAVIWKTLVAAQRHADRFRRSYTKSGWHKRAAMVAVVEVSNML